MFFVFIPKLSHACFVPAANSLPPLGSTICPINNTSTSVDSKLFSISDLYYYADEQANKFYINFSVKIPAQLLRLKKDGSQFVVGNDLGKVGITNIESVSGNIGEDGDYYVTPTYGTSTINITTAFNSRTSITGERSLYVLLQQPVDQNISNLLKADYVQGSGEAILHWSSASSSVSSVNIAVTMNGIVLATSIDNTGSFVWKPRSSGLYSFRFTDNSNPNNFANVGPYRIDVVSTTSVSSLVGSKPSTLAPVMFTASVGSSCAFFLGDTLPITWVQRIMTSNVKIDLYKGSTLAKNISTGIAASKKQSSYVLPKTLVPGSDYTIKVTDKSNSAVFANTSVFQIKKPEITLNPVSPNTLAGQPLTFTWSNTGNIKSFDVKVISGTTGKTVASKTVSVNAKSADLGKAYTWKTSTKAALGAYKFTVSDHADKTNIVESQSFNLVKVMPVSENTIPSMSKSFLGNVWSSVRGWWR